MAPRQLWLNVAPSGGCLLRPPRPSVDHTPKTLSSSRVIHGLLEARRSSPSECCVTSRSCSWVEYTVFSWLTSSARHRPRTTIALALAIDLGNRSGFENEVAIGKDLGDFRHDSCGEGVFALEFTFGFVPVLNGAGDGGQSLGLGVVRTELFVQQSAEVGPLVDSGVQVSPPLGGEFRRAARCDCFHGPTLRSDRVRGRFAVCARPECEPLAGGWCPTDHGGPLFARALVLRHQDALARSATHRE